MGLPEDTSPAIAGNFSGGPAVLGISRRPEALRPHLSMGLPLSVPIAFSIAQFGLADSAIATLITHDVRNRSIVSRYGIAAINVPEKKSNI